MGTSKLSGWGLFLFLTGFMLLPTPAVGFPLGLWIGLVLVGASFYVFKMARMKEEQ